MKPDLFTNVHKGLRRALFDLCLTLGQLTDGDLPARREAERRAREVLRFLHHHGQNEDELLLPLLERRAPGCHARLVDAHAAIAVPIAALESSLATASAPALYHLACALTAAYLDHMREEELELAPQIEAALTLDEQRGFGAASVARTAPDDQLMMLGHMFAAMPRPEVEAFLGRMPPAMAARFSS